MITNKEKVKIPLLLPLGIAILILLGSSIVAIYWLQHRNIEQQAGKNLESVQSLFQKQLAEDALLLKGLLDFLEKDKTLQSAWLAGNRDELLGLVKPIFEDLRSKYNVTHLYFHNLDRTCFLRAHDPPRFGDYIDRFTLDKALREQKESWGIELGPLGTFTLRMVHPWPINGTVVGYLELGRDIKYIAPKIAEALDVELVFAIDKSYLNRKGWEEGLRVMGRNSNWDFLPNFVISESTIENIPPKLGSHIVPLHPSHQNTLFTVPIGNRTYQGGFIRLFDAGGREVGDIIVLKDISESLAQLRALSMIMIAICTVVGGAILVSFYLYIGRIELGLTTAQKSLKSEIEKRKKIEDELWKHQEHLEDLVERRTHELQTTNEQLELEVNTRKRAEEDLEDLNRELEYTIAELSRSNSELRSFARIVSHDLKTPLRGIVTLADWLLMDYSDRFDDRGKEQVKLLAVRAKRISNMISGILEYSEVGNERGSRKKVDMNALVKEVITSLDPPKNIEIIIEDELPVIRCQEDRLAKVFRYLLDNSIKYIDKPNGLIRINCTEEKGFWKFSIADNGQGIEEKYFEKIFQIFQVLSPHDEAENVGIGLPMVKKIVELYGGQVWCQSEPGLGSTFFFTLPVQEVKLKDRRVKISV